MAVSQTTSVQLAAANPQAVAASQTPSTPGPLVLTAMPVVLDTARRILVTTTANEAGKTLTVTGTDRGNAAISEILALPAAGTVQSVQDFRTVRTAVISSAAAGPVSVGTSGAASSRWLLLNQQLTPVSADINVNFGGNAGNVTVQQTADPIDMALFGASYPGVFFPQPVTRDVLGLTAITTDSEGLLSIPTRAIRLVVNSGAGPVRLTVTQAGLT